MILNSGKVRCPSTNEYCTVYWNVQSSEMWASAPAESSIKTHRWCAAIFKNRTAQNIEMANEVLKYFGIRHRFKNKEKKIWYDVYKY